MMGEVKKIRRNMMLKEIDIKWLPGGKRNLFSIKFITKTGSVHFFPYAYATGLNHSAKEARQRGIQPCNHYGVKQDHIYPVGIDAILMFNNMEVIL